MIKRHLCYALKSNSRSPQMTIKTLHARIVDLLSRRTHDHALDRAPKSVEPPLEPDLRDRVDVWVNEGGAGGEVNR
jgi:hypothetical protein